MRAEIRLPVERKHTVITAMSQGCIGNRSEKLATKGHIRGRKGGRHHRLSKIYRRSPKAPLFTCHPTNPVQLSHRHPRQVAWNTISLHPALPFRYPRDAE